MGADSRLCCTAGRNFFIYQENGERIQVIGSFVFPLIDKYERAGETDSDLNEASGRPVSNLGLGKYITNNFNDKIFDTYGYAHLAFVRKGNLKGDICFGLQLYFAATVTKRLRYKAEGGYSYKEVLLADILYIECNGHELSYHIRPGEKFRVYGSLKSL